MTTNNLAIQKQRAEELIKQIDRPIDKEWQTKPRGFSLRKPGGFQFGFIRFNIGRPDPQKYSIYVYQPFSDPNYSFSPTRDGKEGHSIVDPSDETAIQYAISVLQSSYDNRN